MKCFAILRSLSPNLTWEEVDSSAIENMVYMGLPESERELAWEPRVLGVSWIRSYWEPGSDWGLCLYTGPTEEAVKDWHDLCGVPYAGIREVDVEESGPGSDYPRGFHEPAHAAPLIAIETALPGSWQAPADFRWIRTYRDANGAEIRLYLPAKPSHSDSASSNVNTRRVVEIRPDDYQ